MTRSCHHRATLTLIGLLLAALACSERFQPEVVSSPRDTATGSVPTSIVENVGGGTAATLWMTREVTTIGTVDGPEPYQFARIAAVDVDSDGNVYVLDSGHRRVRKYDRSGQFVIEMGGDGGGPGEFRRPPGGLAFDLGGMTLVGDSSVAVHDPWKWTLTYFDRDGTFRREVSLELPAPELVFARRSRALVDLGAGWLLLHQVYPFGVGRATSARDGRHMLIRVTTDGQRSDTLITYEQDDVIYRTVDERHGEFFHRPFAPRSHWAVGPSGRIAFGNGRTFEITIRERNGNPIRRVKSTVQAARVTREHIEGFKKAFPFGIGMDSLPPSLRRVATGVLHDLEFPKQWPAFDDLQYDPAERLWVRRHPLPTDSMAEWDVLDTDLQYLGSILLPNDIVVLKITKHRVFSLVREVDGVEFLRVDELVPTEAFKP